MLSYLVHQTNGLMDALVINTTSQHSQALKTSLLVLYNFSIFHYSSDINLFETKNLLVAIIKIGVFVNIFFNLQKGEKLTLKSAKKTSKNKKAIKVWEM